jgi:pimeloyl-ACP methyl ester carboxylesterase
MKLDVAIHPAAGARRGGILFLHGAWSWNWYWQVHFMPYFAAAGYDAIAPSLRGHGGSEGLSQINHYSIGDYVEDLHETVAKFQPDVIVGHSMGGFITQAYFARYPARAGAGPQAVLLAAAAPRPQYGHLLKTLAAQPMTVLRAALNKTVPPGTANLAGLRESMFSRGPDDTSMDHYLGNIQPESYRAIASMIGQGLRARPVFSRRPMVIGAGRDRLVPPSSVLATASAYRTRPVMFREMSHMVMLEPDWREVADEILRYVQSGIA